MLPSDVQVNEFVVLWKKSTGEDISREEARLKAARLLQLYRTLVSQLPSNRSPIAEAYRPVETAAQLTPESS